jgi:trans-aconitate methyltransferase
MVQQKWNAGLYNEKHAFVYEFGASLIALLTPQKDERILDIGCGSGQLTQQIANSGAWVTGIDSSEEMIADARAKFPALDFRVMDASLLSFTEEFDALFSNATLHWVLDAEGAAAGMYRALKKGGRMVVEFGGKDNVQTILWAIRKCLEEHGFQEQAKKEVWYFPSIGEYTTLLERQGFRVTMAQHFDRPTELADASHGIEDWLEMFAQTIFNGISQEKRKALIKEIQQQVRPILFDGHKWHADYKRIRVVAVKE